MISSEESDVAIVVHSWKWIVTAVKPVVNVAMPTSELSVVQQVTTLWKPSGIKMIEDIREVNMQTIVEIRAAEGGDDAKLLVKDLFNIYKKTANQESF